MEETSQNQTLSTQENVAVVKARLQEEGREARNLIAYSLPLENRKTSVSTSNSERVTEKPVKILREKKISNEGPRLKQAKRHRSASAGRDPHASLRARHWGFLFRNLQQAVDEIYQTAEDDESIIECKEAILMLERYTNDFYKLIEWFKIKWEYENTAPPQRPTSLAWEIRTSSPGKIFKSEKRNLSLSDARRALNFNQAHSPGRSVSLKKKVDVLQISCNEADSSSANIKNGKEFTPINNLISKSDQNFVDRNFAEPFTKIFQSNVMPSLANGISEKVSGKSELYSITESQPGDESVEIKQSNEDSDVLTVPPSTRSSSSSNVSSPSQTNHSQNGHSTLYASKLKDLTTSPSATKICKQKLIDIQPEAKVTAKDTATKNDVENVTEEISNCSNDETKTKDEAKAVSKEEKKLKEDSKIGSDVDTKKGSPEYQPKHLHPRPGPLVNMNKASQVRKAFNQSKTPIKGNQGCVWKQTSSPMSDCKINCSKQQGSGGRLVIRRLTDGKQAQSPPLNRRTPGYRIGPYSTSDRGIFDRSSNSYPSTRALTRSSTTLDSSSTRGQFYKVYTNDRTTLSDGKYPSTASLASSSNTSSSGLSWADKVKGNHIENKDSASQTSLQVDDDDEGWEVVRRHRRSHGSAASLNSQKVFSNFSSHSDLEKKGSFPLQMKSRFHQPTSAVSMPSLFASSDTDDQKRRESLPRSGGFSSQKYNLDGKGSKHNMKRVNPKKKKIHKDNTSSSTGNLTGNSSSRCTRFCKDNENLVKKTSNIDKDKKDAFNTKTQSKSKDKDIRKDSDKVQRISKDSDKQQISPYGAIPSVCNLPDVALTNENLSDVKDENNALNPQVLDTKGDQPNRKVILKDKKQSVYVSNQARIAKDSSDFMEQGSSDSESEREEEQMRCNEEAFECVIEMEKKLKQQIEETQRTSIEVCDDDDYIADTGNDAEGLVAFGNVVPDKNEVSIEKDNFYELAMSVSKASVLSWAEEMDAIDKLDSLRPPGRVLHIHEKLSSPSRKLPISEKLRRHEEKLAKAEELRGKRISVKTEKLRDLFRKIDEVNIDKERLLYEKRGLFERKMERAEEKRRCHLQEIVNKAHDEENKAKEIAFINGLEAQNKLHDIMQQHQSHESRLADMAEERSRKLEEKAAKEAAAQERRKALEAERKARMLELCEKRRKRCERIDRQQAERREELLEQAREKARDREERRSALQQAQQAKESELVKKIQQKQEETARRHEENIEQIRQKALESSIMKYSRGSDEAPKLRRYETKKLCTLCNSVITSEVYLLSHLRGLQHEESLKELHKRDVSLEESETYNLKFIIDAPPNVVDSQVTKDKERQKALKKRCRKIRTRMTSRGKAFLKDYVTPNCKDSAFKSRMSKSLSQIGKLISSQGSGPWLSADVTLLDRHLLELHRLLEKCGDEEQKAFLSLDGFRRLFLILNLILCGEEESQCVIPARSLAFCAKVLHFGAKGSKENCRFLLNSNLVGNIIEQLNRRLNDMSGDFTRNGSSNSLNTIAALPSDPAAAALMELLAQNLRDINGPVENDQEMEKGDGVWPRLQDVVSYCVSMGITDKISWYFNHVQNPVENDPPSAEIILSSMSLLSALSAKLCGRSQSNDPTQLIGTFHALDACGVVSLLYGLLLHQGGRSPTPPSDSLLSPSTVAISAAATTLLHSLAELDLKMFQSILGGEGISLEFRHIASFLLWYCSHWPCEEILHNVISLVGFFAVNNKENQSIIQSGETPSVLQQLCSLPWPYFSEPHLTSVLFPTLLACCLHNDDNLNILQQEMSFQVLEEYLESNNSPKKPLLQILHSLNLGK